MDKVKIQIGLKNPKYKTAAVLFFLGIVLIFIQTQSPNRYLDFDQPAEISNKQLILHAREYNVLAAFLMGTRFHNGQEGLDIDIQEAVHWYTQAANQGHIESQLRLGNLYYTGEGVEKNLDEAFLWFTEASGLDNEAATLSLAKMYANGESVDKNYMTAAELYIKASNTGNIDVQRDLALLYIQASESGNAVAKVSLTSLYNQASAEGNESATRARSLLYFDWKPTAKW